MARASSAESRTRAAPAAAASNYPVIKDKRVIALVEEYAAGASEKGRLEARLKELKPEIEAALGEAPTAFVGARVVSRTEVPPIPETPNRVITREMIGQVIPGEKGRRGYSMLKVQ